MYIAHLTDTHIVPPGALLNNMIDSAAQLRSVIDQINILSPKADAVIVSGDLVNDATDAAYDHLLTLLAELKAPYFLIPGNHDDRSKMSALFGGREFFPVTEGFAQYSVDRFKVRLIGLDSTGIGREQPEFCDTRAQWLRSALLEQPDKPTLLFIHHPPITTGVGFFDEVAETGWSDPLRKIVEQFDCVELIACGHVHTHISGSCGGKNTVAAIGSASTLVSEIGEDRPPALIEEPGQLLVHYWTGDTMITHARPPMPTSPDARIDKLAGMSWDDLKTLWRSK